MRHHLDPLIFANFTLSRVDPILHSSLIYLNEPELDKSNDLLDFLANNVRAFLTRLMLENTEVGMKPPVIDDAHLWWGHYELLKREGKEYCVNGRKGYSMAAEVCQRLIYKNNRFFAFPPRRIAIDEIPPDIYGVMRTRPLILMNCIKISTIMPLGVDTELPRLLSECIMQHLELVNK